ncbi:DNA starvation/stationary phase protection protein [Streptomyces griseoviridis]|jgi:starvation-inducible DNA-binding protein|uniref:DNA starvation/stationary phase protection protein n=3 Tax=Streptomyces TaxID=1883 RepID=A0A918GDS5_STRGD|nr:MULTISPECIES: DNA starvation/stationary phase protection protein [Streptomyces]MDP9685613.1 starvation-inducible DNA-binding protein [Streptomyces griseoviridis]GGS31750.1 DNA starvation/stationary phase protection protein [Streptomyces niveoruber]GGS88722.1 DNA starvation/stationary phase protection protein [Streptomyces griseoviridis]GGU29268.1 DNA starvation/stationary phase protection protein [Streptomyces daghestanicus]GHI34904.1 DNA starvation/stationary phase protection protein [Stre
MTVVKSTIPESARQVTGEALQSTLVDLLGLSLIAKQVHWNIVGPRFRSIHLQLDEVVASAREFADTVAERSSALGIPADGRPETIATAFTLPSPKDGWVRDEDAVALMTETLGAAIARLRERIKVTDEPDPVTQDLLISITAELEKQRWMFDAENWPKGD